MKKVYTLPLVRILEVRTKNMLMESYRSQSAHGQNVTMDDESDIEIYFGS